MGTLRGVKVQDLEEFFGRKFVWYVFLPSISILTAIVLYIHLKIHSESCDYGWRDLIDREFHGIIKDKFIGDHRVSKITLSNGKKAGIGEFDSFHLYDLINIGDSISKHKNSLEVVLFKESDTLFFKLEAPECQKYMHR